MKNLLCFAKRGSRILGGVHLIAFYSQDPQFVAALEPHQDPRYHLHPVSPQQPSARVFAALGPLEFAGALVVGQTFQEQALSHVQRSSLEAREAGLIDTVTVTPAGLVGEYLFGKALSRALRAEGWDARGARAVILGGSPEAGVIARELASLGVRHLAVLAADRPSAERSLPVLPPSAEWAARAVSEAAASLFLEQADILVRSDPALKVDATLLGPHLGVVDLSAEPLSLLRRQALEVGAKTLGLRDVQAYQVCTALEHILGSPLEVERFLGLFHGGAG